MMKLTAVLAVLTSMLIPHIASAEDAAEGKELCPWYGKYPLTFLYKARSAKTVGEGRTLFCLKNVYFDYDEVKTNGSYNDLAPGDKYEQFTTILVAKYGWAKDHHIAVGIPYVWTDFKAGASEVNSDGFSNIYVFEKWNLLKESDNSPAVAVDLWYYFSSGDAAEKRGSDDDFWKITTELSKAWEKWSLHFNPGYQIRDGPDFWEVNAALLVKPCKKLWPVLEYNYIDKDKKGDSHAVVPGFVWKAYPGLSVKLGAIINVDTDLKYKDDLGGVLKVSYCF